MKLEFIVKMPMNGKNHEKGRKLDFSWAVKEKWGILNEHGKSHICLLLGQNLIVEDPRLNLFLELISEHTIVLILFSCLLYVTVYLNIFG